ncbi:MAG: hypothetical protein M3146_04305 [Thermoproteota archaeon]|nr:hypothetical protein [Thermoproteota archaeon]
MMELGRQKGFEVEAGKDYGAGSIDVVWHIKIHPALRDITCRFIITQLLAKTLNEAIARGEVKRREDFEDDQSWQEYHDKEAAYLKDIEEAAFRGTRSGLDKVYLVAENEEAAKAISGKIEWLASHGSLVRLDAICLGSSMDQRGSSVIKPSQKRIPKDEKLRKQAIRRREAKLERYNRPKGERRVREPKEKRKEREEKLERFSRPKGQKLKKKKITSNSYRRLIG